MSYLCRVSLQPHKLIDFTFTKYQELLTTLQQRGYVFLTFAGYCRAKQDKTLPLRFVILRHDVDKHPEHSLHCAHIEYEMGICASYYFRIKTESHQPNIIRNIAALGHEIGYHYEDFSSSKGNPRKAIRQFEQSLEYFRQFYPVSTICMHGAPTCRWDERLLWKDYRYQDYGIIGEPYFDVDFSQVFYLTDTGRCWDGYQVSVYDKIPLYQAQWIQQGLKFHHTDDIIRAMLNDSSDFPLQVMINTHPQRWSNNIREWTIELVAQNLKNVIKRLLILIRHL